MYHPVCVARVYVWLCEQKNCSAINKTKTKKNVRHWNEVKKKRQKRKNLDSLLVWDQHFPGLAAVSVWVCEKFTLFIVHAHCMAPRFQIPNSWDSFSDQLNTVLKLCHLSCIHRNSWSASQFQRNQLNSVFESCFTFVVRLFHCLTAQS